MAILKSITPCSCMPAGRNTALTTPAGCIPCYPSMEDNPEIFPFAYERVDYVNKTETDGGVLYDFGKETFSKAVLEGLDPQQKLGVFYGESREEALADEGHCCIWEYVSGQDT